MDLPHEHLRKQYKRSLLLQSHERPSTEQQESPARLQKGKNSTSLVQAQHLENLGVNPSPKPQ